MATTPSRIEKAELRSRTGISPRVARARAWIEANAATGPFDRPAVPFHGKGPDKLEPGDAKK